MIRLLCLSLLFVSATAPAQSAAAPVDVRQQGAARLENVPAIPADIKKAVQLYQNYRQAQFEDWLPDGSLLITTRFGATSQVHHVQAPLTARTQLTFHDEPVARAWTVPGSDRFAYSRDTGGDEWFQLFVRSLSGGDTVQLTEPGTRNQSPVFSSDGRLMAWARATRGSDLYAILTADPIDPSSRKVEWQASGNFAPSDLSADGRLILVNHSLSNRENRLLILDRNSGQVTPLDWSRTEPVRFEDPRFARQGRSIIAITNKGSDYRRLVEIDVESGHMHVLSGDRSWDVEGYDLSRDGRLIAYVVNEEGYSNIILQDFLTRRSLPQPEQPDAGVVTALKFSPDGGRIAFALSSATSAGDVHTIDVARGGKAKRWTRSELGDLDQQRLSRPELIRFESFDGLSVPAFVYRPRGAGRGSKMPVIIDIHGGPESQTRPSWNPGAQYFTGTLGAAVILPNVRGSEGYGTDYLNLDNGPKREDSVRDIGALLDWIARQPDLDPDRVAVYGQSYGGYMSLASMIHFGERLVGGVERYGISNWTSFLENTEAYRRDNRRGEYGDERDPQMRALFDRISPLNNVDRITRPMLIMQGANDPRVPQSESDQIVRELRSNGVEAWYVLFSDEGHGFHKKPNNDLRRGVETIFLRRLFGQDAAADAATVSN